MLRKSGYRLFSLEMMEAKNEDLTLFEDKNDMKKFVENIHKFMESEEYSLLIVRDKILFAEFVFRRELGSN